MFQIELIWIEFWIKYDNLFIIQLKKILNIHIKFQGHIEMQKKIHLEELNG